MKRILSITIVLLASITMAFAQAKGDGEFHFHTFIQLMNFGAQGKNLSFYSNYAKNAGLTQIYEQKDHEELYYVWAKDVTYSKGHMTETYTKTGNSPKAMNVDVIPTKKGLYVPMTVTLIFNDAKAQKRFRDEGIKYGCEENSEIYSTDVDPTWSNVSCIKYRKHKLNKSWRYIFFYEKDGMHMCTFLF